jgi:hypothetical protein
MAKSKHIIRFHNLGVMFLEDLIYLSDEELKSYGFYEVVIPDYDSRIQELGDLYLDSK